MVNVPVHRIFYLLIALVLVQTGSAMVMQENQSVPDCFGNIQISGSPVGFKIFIDAEPYGILPESGIFLINNLSCASHQIHVSMDGFAPYEQDIQITGKNSTFIQVALKKKVSSLDIISNPPNVQIFIDDSYKGITPTTIPDLPPGDHTVQLKLSGYQDWQQVIDVKTNGNQSVSADLTPLKERKIPGFVSVLVLIALIGVGLLQIRRNE